MHEAFGLRDALGLLCIAGGVVLVVTQVPDVQLFLTSEVIWYHVSRQARALVYMMGLFIFVPFWMVWVVPKHKSKHPAVYLILCSAIASVTVVSSRAFASILTKAMASGDYTPLYSSWVPVIALSIIIVTAIWSTAYLQKAMAIFPNNKVVPTYYVTFTLASVCAGAVVYREFDCMDNSQPPLFTAGCLTTFVGVFLTASKGRRGPGSRRPHNARVGSASAARRHVELLEGDDPFSDAAVTAASASPRTRGGDGDGGGGGSGGGGGGSGSSGGGSSSSGGGGAAGGSTLGGGGSSTLGGSGGGGGSSLEEAGGGDGSGGSIRSRGSRGAGGGDDGFGDVACSSPADAAGTVTPARAPWLPSPSRSTPREGGALFY